MAHFAKISEDNEVLLVLAFNDKDMLDENGNESELIGQKYLEKHHNWPAHLWIQTSCNTNGGKHTKGKEAFRGNFAGIGLIWDPDNKIFLRKKPFPSWIKDIPNASWKSPIGDAPVFTEEQIEQNKQYPQTWSYQWNELNQTWDLINFKIS